MKKIVLLLSVLLPVLAHAASTINSTNKYAWGANFGWMDWRPSAADGVVIGEYVCSGYVYGANVGWINLGNGAPTNHIQYSNTSATDFGLNYTIDPTMPGVAVLRGYAYGANIGWINFENTGNPRLRFSNGHLEGYAYSANCGWINLGDGSFTLSTDFIAPGVDSEPDGMADAFEFLYLGGLAGNPNADNDGDGMTNAQEYLEGTDPTLAGDRFQVISGIITAMSGTDTTTQLVWTSNLSRLYAIDTTLDLRDPNSWVDLAIDGAPNSIIPSIGPSTTRTVLTPNAPRRFFRARAIRPLIP